MDEEEDLQARLNLLERLYSTFLPMAKTDFERGLLNHWREVKRRELRELAELRKRDPEAARLRRGRKMGDEIMDAFHRSQRGEMTANEKQNWHGFFPEEKPPQNPPSPKKPSPRPRPRKPRR